MEERSSSYEKVLWQRLFLFRKNKIVVNGDYLKDLKSIIDGNVNSFVGKERAPLGKDRGHLFTTVSARS